MGEETQLKKAKLLNDSILVKVEEGGKETKSGLILPSSKHTEGTVVKTGPGAYTQQGEQLPLQVSVGDFVRLKNDEEAYKDVELDGIKYKFANEREIIVVLESNDS